MAARGGSVVCRGSFQDVQWPSEGPPEKEEQACGRAGGPRSVHKLPAMPSGLAGFGLPASGLTVHMFFFFFFNYVRTTKKNV